MSELVQDTTGNANETFRLPSTALFLGLMPIFSGLARRADLAAVLSDIEKRDIHGESRSAKVQTYIVHAGRESRAKTSVSLFDNDPLWNEGELSSLIKRQFGPAGLKHLLGVMIAAEEQALNAQQEKFPQNALFPALIPGSFVFDASHHLDILGYKRSNRVNGKGYHTAKHLREAREIVTLLCSLTIVQEVRLGSRRGATLKIRLLLDEASSEAWEETVADGERMKERIVTNEKLFLRFNPHLFNAAAEGTPRMQNQYTHQLRRLSRENARNHGLVLTLGVHLPIKFRMNNCQPLELTARSFLRMAGIVEEEYTRFTHLEQLENALRYMVEQGYLHSFETERYRYIANEQPVKNGGRRSRSLHELKGSSSGPHPEPLEEIWRVDPPPFLVDLLRNAVQPALDVRGQLEALAQTSAPRGPRAAQPLLPGIEEGRPPTPGEMLKMARGALHLQQAELAAKLGVTQAAVSMAEAGKRPRMAQRLFEAARRLTPGS